MVRSLFLVAFALLAGSIYVFAAVDFSGVYLPRTDLTFEVYSGAFLMTTKRLKGQKEMIDKITSLEQGTTSVALSPPYNGQDAVKHIMMTRDYFDFAVEHLSAMTNRIENHDWDDLILENATKKARYLKNMHVDRFHPFRNMTIALMPFSTNPASSYNRDVDVANKIRMAFFEQTFWSIYKAFKHIAVSVTRAKDLERLLSMNLPITKIFASTINDDPKSNYASNVRQALSLTIDELNQNVSWSRFKYFYYSEGDLPLHFRRQKEILQLFENTDPSTQDLVLAPHRMQGQVLPREFVPKQGKTPAASWLDKVTQNVNLIIEKSRARGSCCDDGRWIFPSCGNMWYNCQEFGLINMTEWIKFGTYGVTMALTTEHLGRCKYYEKQVTCPIPPDCKTSTAISSFKELCLELNAKP